MLGKNRRKKVRKRILIFTRISWPKNGGWGKRANQLFQKHANNASQKWCEKNRRKKIVGKNAKNVFFYSHEYRDQKMGGKNARNNFSRKTRIVREKNGKKIVGKKCEKCFFIFIRISWPKDRGKKGAKKFFQKHTNSASIKCWEKNLRKKVRKTFFYIHTNIVT